MLYGSSSSYITLIRTSCDRFKSQNFSIQLLLQSIAVKVRTSLKAILEGPQ